ncbi:hypothetical protein HYT55_00615 [Candidatus Woesearchaeota archaeon]|nr:hypothetical protein [Candidatus Woesearchaeota archaeon]
MALLSPLCQLSGGCMGCCGHDYPSAEKIRDAIRENTTEFKAANPQTEQEFLQFRDRRSPMDLRFGVCRNLILESGCNFCPLHPARHQGKDLRINHCDINYLCKTAKIFETWSDEKQQRFVLFIESKKLDNITYSLKMDKSLLLNEFLIKEDSSSVK